MSRDTCVGVKEEIIRRGHSCNISEPEHQVPRFRDPSAGRLTPTGCNLLRYNRGATLPVPHAHVSGVNSPQPPFSNPLRPHVPEVYGFCIRGQLSATENPSAQTQAPRPTRGRATPLSAMGWTWHTRPLQTHGAALACYPSQRPDLSSFFLSGSGSLVPYVYCQPPRTWHTSECQRPVSTSSCLTCSCATGAQESWLSGLFLKKERVAMVTWKAHNAEMQPQ